MKEYFRKVKGVYVEFNCPCCGKNEMNQLFIDTLRAAREYSNTPFVINSGYRCEKHNKKIGGVSSSTHIVGSAADIHCTESRQRALILCGLLEAGFSRIGIAKTFIHVDMADRLEGKDNKVEAVFWLY
tara:strand:+ start:140 stop:523 length:384 start_codon:yes stop_codon:yes gene_type:complete